MGESENGFVIPDHMDSFVMTRQAGGTQFIYQNDISLVLPKNSTRMEYK